MSDKLLVHCWGGLFEHGDDAVELAFRYAVDRINADNRVLPHTRLVAQVERLEKCDSFQASKRGNKLHYNWLNCSQLALICRAEPLFNPISSHLLIWRHFRIIGDTLGHWEERHKQEINSLFLSNSLFATPRRSCGRLRAPVGGDQRSRPVHLWCAPYASHGDQMGLQVRPALKPFDQFVSTSDHFGKRVQRPNKVEELEEFCNSLWGKWRQVCQKSNWLWYHPIVTQQTRLSNWPCS